MYQDCAFIRLRNVLLAAACLTFIAAAPADKFSLPGQHRTRTCVEMKSPIIPLRFADGEPTGFYVRADDPSRQGGKRPCGAGFMEIDAHETLKTAGGMTLYFHPGGGPDHYQDYVENGQYGHIAAADLKSAPKLVPADNGRRADTSGASYCIAPVRIPHEMLYKAEGKSGSSYANYGNPGYDKTDGRGDWTYIVWSWVQKGGGKYPDNITHGGGLVRALGKRDARFIAADVEPIIGYSYGMDNPVNGRVSAIYGQTNPGPEEHGSPIYGWLAFSFQQQGGPIVPCVRRWQTTSGKTEALAEAAHRNDGDPLERMARNLLSELNVDPATAQKMRVDWIKRYAEEKEPVGRMEILSEMSRVDDGQTVAAMLEPLEKEQDPRVREQCILLLGFMRSTVADMKTVCGALLKDFRRSTDARERLQIVDAASIVPAPESVILIRAIAKSLQPTEQDEELHLAVADTLQRLVPRMSVDSGLVEQTRNELKRLARGGSFSSRERAVHALAAPAWNDRAFLRELLADEKSPVIRRFLTKVTASPGAVP